MTGSTIYLQVIIFNEEELFDPMSIADYDYQGAKSVVFQITRLKWIFLYRQYLLLLIMKQGERISSRWRRLGTPGDINFVFAFFYCFFFFFFFFLSPNARCYAIYWFTFGIFMFFQRVSLFWSSYFNFKAVPSVQLTCKPSCCEAYHWPSHYLSLLLRCCACFYSAVLGPFSWNKPLIFCL